MELHLIAIGILLYAIIGMVVARLVSDPVVVRQRNSDHALDPIAYMLGWPLVIAALLIIGIVWLLLQAIFWGIPHPEEDE